jgi:hypothetical protein
MPDATLRWRRGSSAALLLVAGAAAVALALDGSSRPAVSARGPRDPARDDAILVRLRNEGLAPLTGVRLRCVDLRIERVDGSSDSRVLRIEPDGEIAPSPRAAQATPREAVFPWLAPGATKTAWCPAAPGPTWAGAELALELRYSVLHLPREHRRSLRLAGTPGPGGVEWKPARSSGGGTSL